MFGCRKMRGLMAASVYEPLPDRDRKSLARHLAKCGGCRREAESLARLRASIPANPLEPGFDLLPILRRRLAEPRETRRPAYRRWAPAIGLAALTVAVAASLFAGPGTRHTVSPIAPTPVQLALAQADRSVEAKDYAGAFQALKESLAHHPHDPRAGQAQLRLADLAYAHLQLYDEADAAYRKLVSDYEETYENSPEHAVVRDRLELLDEGRKESYRSLYAYERARRNPGSSLDLYEKIVASKPDGFVAEMAVRDMVALTMPEAAAGDAGTRMAALETVRERLKDPVAVAKVNVEIGNLAWRELDDPVRAKDAFLKAAAGPEPVLASVAQDSLEELYRTRPGLRPNE